jgi:WD repeat-containing protein mio
LIRLEWNSKTDESGVLSRGPVVTLPQRNSRACNALAFSDTNPNLLACGLDKVRGDPRYGLLVCLCPVL